MRDRIIATGAESVFVKSWSGWDEVDTLAIQLYDAVFTDDFASVVGVKGVDCVAICYEKCYIEGYNFTEGNDSQVVFHHKFKLTLV